MTSIPQYPPSPAKIDPAVLKPSREFRRDTVKVLGGLFFFVATYLLLVVAAVGLALLCAAAGIFLVVLKPMIVTIMLGIGLAGLGIMVIAFLVKFLFKRHRVDRSGLIELTKEDHPRLHEFIRTLANETQTSFPKRIYLSPDVNACVFYDSSFWSMFLPIRKNLQIGLGLVNAVNMSEFKAIIAHEFGHFSQRSMKLGSYVYNMNHVIFNMLYDNEGYESTVRSWGSTSNYFSFFAALTIAIVKGIQEVLRQVYSIVNRTYMGLSRQMEFHADTVSACVSGGNHLVTSLRRLDVAEITFGNVFDFYRGNLKDGLKPDNIYPQHMTVMAFFASHHSLKLDHGLPQVDAASFKSFNRSRIVIKDQWASHPSTDDREQHLLSLKLETPTIHNSAWELFEQPDVLQRTVTESVFAGAPYSVPVKMVTNENFHTRYEEQIKKNELPNIYRGFYDGREISTVDLDSIVEDSSLSKAPFKEILKDDLLALPYEKNGMLNDLHLLSIIAAGQMKINSFEFEGAKYKIAEVPALRVALEKQQKKTDQKILDADRKIIAWFLHNVEHREAERLRDLYRQLFRAKEQRDPVIELYNGMSDRIAPFYKTAKVTDIPFLVKSMKSLEVTFRERLTEMLTDTSNESYITVEQRETANNYLSKDREYFRAQNYIERDLEALNQSLSIFCTVAIEKVSRLHREVLTTQAEVARVELSPREN